MDISTARQSAKRLVEQIAKDHGYLGEEKLRRIEPDIRRELEEVFLKKDLTNGSPVITLAENLYTSKARFIFELLQNADDNSYDRAINRGAVPYISFRVYPRRIVVDCNEEGFSHANVKAICSVGKSTKTGAQGYIGERDIGFKSVFMAAWKVHIQSGVFSFSFTHKPGDSGLGMISPSWEDAEKLRESPLTRITLHLHETGDSEILAKRREAIQEQFKDLQETVLLFTKNLRRISVSFFNDDEEQTSSITYSIKRPKAHYAVLKRTKAADNQEETEVKHFHVTTHKVTDLAKNEYRKYSGIEETTQAYSKSQIILAFPLSDTSVPVTEPQDLFNFLPVRKVGFKFLIQADFVTDASGKDIVKHSRRNNDLLDGIADAFVKAVLQLLEHNTLRYQWMKYLPDKTSMAWGSFWVSLVNKIEDRLSTTPVLFSRDHYNQHLINDLLCLSDDEVDEKGKPLFDDGKQERTISQHYDKEALEILTDYGLQFVSYQAVKEWLRNDLKRGQQSKMKSPKTSQYWHFKAVKLIQRHFIHDSDSKNRIDELNQMDLLPLQNGDWVSPSSGSVYLAKTNGMDIPQDIGLRLISKDVNSPTRILFFIDLGVTPASISLVREKILQRYPRDENSSPLSLSESKRHLEFLYLSHHLRGDKESSYSVLSIFNTKMDLLNPYQNFMYIANDQPYGPWELLRKTDPGPNLGDGAPGYLGNFIHEEYFKDIPSTPQGQHLTWTEWICSELTVERLTYPGVTTVQYVQKYRPEKFLGWLRLRTQGGETLSESIVDCLRETEVLCRGNRQCLLKNTYFPTKELESRVERYVGQSAFFPWLWLDTEATPDTIPSDWKSLATQLKIDCSPRELDFALEMLNYSLGAFSDTIDYASMAKLLELYEHIQLKFLEDDDRAATGEKIRTAFSENKRICIPLGGNRYTLAVPNECVWNAPQELKSKYSLRHLYKPWLCTDGANLAHLENFFTTTLGVTGCTWETYIHELKTLRDSGCDSIDTISGIYTALDDLQSRFFGINKDLLKKTFEDNALIYFPSDDGPAWHKASQCVWSSTTRIRGKASLHDKYEHLEELFVKLIDVKPVDLLMAIGELQEAGRRHSISEQEVKKSIWAVNSLLSTASRYPNPRDVVNSRIFPIKHPDGSVTLESKATEFFIVDREPLRQMFATKVKFLNFTLEEVVQLRGFFEWVDLGARYLSLCVKETTSFHGGVAIQTSNSDRQIRNRAHALLRIAAHFNSPHLKKKQNPDHFYQVLKNADIFETDGISSDLSLSQDRHTHEVPGKMTTLHIDADDLGLKIYVPSNKDDQAYTFTKLLPQKLFEWMIKGSLTNISEKISNDGVIATRDVLLAPRSRIARALDDNGIAAIAIVNTDDVVLPESYSPATPVRTSEASSENTTPSGRGDSDSEVFDTPASSIMSLPLRCRDADTSARNSYFVPLTPRPISTSPLLLPTRPSTPAPTKPIYFGTSNYYITLLDKVIDAGRRGIFPNHGEINRSQSQSSVSDTSDTTDWGMRFVSQIERDSKFAAAGELYVFELLYRLLIWSQLPGFSRNNWQSSVRKYVKVHPDYATLVPWSGTETSDIVYPDNDGLLTKQLIKKGYLAMETWEGRKPKYFIDVKTTTMPCETRFSMSKVQYQRMKDNAIDAENRDTIYAIFRVYNLGRDDMGLKIYIDPESLRLSEQLGFTAETWSVAPSSS